jgi:hypothetical protein
MGQLIEQQMYDGCEGQWPGDGSGMDDLADMNANEANDYADEGYNDDDGFMYADDDDNYQDM